MSANKPTNKKNVQKSKSEKIQEFLEDLDEIPEIPPRVTNKKLLEKLYEMERRMVRMEKLILLLIDDDFFKRDERARVQRIESMVKEGRLDELEELMQDNKFG